MKIVCKLSEDGFEVEESKIINLNLYNYSSNFPHFIGFPACPLVK